MMLKIRNAGAASVLTVLAMASAIQAQAQNYPVRPIRYVVAFSPEIGRAHV
mgnify:CR=1 FL=1